MDIQFSLVPEDFLERITKNPNSRFSDFEIRLAVDILRIYVRDGTQGESHAARELLKKANLSGYIDIKSSYRKTEEHDIRYWQNNIPRFLKIISDMKNQSESIWKKHRKKDRFDDKEEAIKEILIELLKVDITSEDLEDTSSEDVDYIASQELGDRPSQDLVERVGDLEGGRDLHITNLSLSIFAETQNISYSSIRKFYYREDVQEKREKLDILEEEYKLGQLKIANLNNQEIPDISDEELSNNPELGLQINKQAYIKYIENKFSKTKNISPIFYMDLLALVNE